VAEKELSLPDWITKALSAVDTISGWIFGCLAAALAFLLWGPDIGGYGAGDLRSKYGSWIFALVVIFGALSAAQTLRAFHGSVTGWLARRRTRRDQSEAHAEAERAEAHRRRDVLKHLDTLSPDEAKALAWFLANNQRTTTGALTEKILGLLRAKGLMEAHAGSYSRLEIPHTIPEFVWEELQQRREQFLEPRQGRSRR
jgi:hypothetical protein